MRDLWIMPMVMQSPGKDSIVLDKAAKTQFIRPGRVKVSAEFGQPPNCLSIRATVLKAVKRRSPRCVQT